MRAVIAPVAVIMAAVSWAVAPLGAAPGGVGPSAAEGPGGGAVGASAAAPAYGTYAWPVRGRVMRAFEPPESTFGPGHRGIDIEAPLGTRVGAASTGVVAFAGPVAGSLFVSIDHPDGVRTTYSWLSEIAVRRGDHVERGATVGATGSGHAGVSPPHLHFGARIGDTYIDPMLLLERGSLVGLVHLAPLE